MKLVDLFEIKYTADHHEIFGDVFNSVAEPARQPVSAARQTQTSPFTPEIRLEATTETRDRDGRSIQTLSFEVQRMLQHLKPLIEELTTLPFKKMWCWYRIPGADTNNVGGVLDSLVNDGVQSDDDIAVARKVHRHGLPYTIRYLTYTNPRTGAELTRFCINDPVTQSRVIFQWPASTNVRFT